MKLLVLLAILLLIIAGHQLLRIIELSRGLKKTKEWQMTNSDNNSMGKLMLIFMILFLLAFFWQTNRWIDRFLPGSASEHGLKIDWLWDVNMNFIVVPVFLITNFILFWFAYKYRGNTNNKATFFPHSNTLEMIWTVVPAIALAFIIIFGLKYWNEIMADAEDPNKLTIELYAKQFDWTARYAGKDGKLGTTDFKQIGGTNQVGLDTNDVLGHDDITVKNEFHIPIGREIELLMRSRDVIHSAYLPHFRAQMNCVPGLITAFKFKPIKTTEDMRKDPYVIHMMDGINKQRAKFGKEPVIFDYLLLCNKICGENHYNMQMNIIVESEKDYNAWMAKEQAKKTVKAAVASK